MSKNIEKFKREKNKQKNIEINRCEPLSAPISVTHHFTVCSVNDITNSKNTRLFDDFLSSGVR